MPPPTRSTPLAAADLSSLDSVRNYLAAIWLIGCALIFLVFILQSLLGHYDPFTDQAWGWLLPTVLPTLGMIVTVLTYTALDPLSSRAVVRKAFFRIAAAISIAYILIVLLTIAIQPFVATDAKHAVELMQRSNLWLGPIQGLVGSALGVLFVSKKAA